MRRLALIGLFTAVAATAGAAPMSAKTVRSQVLQAYAAAVKVGNAPGACREAIGKSRALWLVRYCRTNSTATHAPCNTANHCALIVDEIRRSCPAEADAPLPCDHGMTPQDWRSVARVKAR